MSGQEPRGPADRAVLLEGGALLDRLQGLLQEQLDLVHQGRLAAAVTLFDQTDQCVRQIAAARGPGAQNATEQWQCLERLYCQLSLALAAQRAEVAAALDALQRGRRILKTYGRLLSTM